MFVNIFESFKLLDKSSFPWILGYIISSIIIAVLDAIGLGLIFVFFNQLLANDINIIQNDVIKFLKIPNYFNFNYLTFLIIILFTMRTILLFASSWVIFSMRRYVELNFISLLFKRYLNHSYIWYLGKNSSDLVNNISHNSSLVIQNIIIGTLDIIGSFLIISFLILTLGTFQPVATFISVSLFSLFGVLFIIIIQKKSQNWGKELVTASALRFRSVKEPLFGLKTVKIFNLERFYTNKVRKTTHKYLTIILKQGIVQITPRLILETVLIIFVIMAIFFAVSSGVDPQRIIPSMAIFAAASIRILPLMTKMFVAVQLIKFSENALDKLREDLVIKEKSILKKIKTTNFYTRSDFRLRFLNISFKYPNSRVKNLEKINITIKEKQKIALVGPSGSGKTTLADIILGLYKPTFGQISLNGKKINEYPTNFFSYVPQDPFMIEDTLKNNIVLGVDENNIDEKKLSNAIKDSVLEDFINKLPEGLDTLVGENGHGLSGGEKQRIAIARGLYRDSKVFVLDEPTSSLDALAENEFTKSLNKISMSKTIIMIAHRLSGIKNFEKIIFLENGKISDIGKFTNLYNKNKNFKIMVDLMSLDTKLEKNK